MVVVVLVSSPPHKTETMKLSEWVIQFAHCHLPFIASLFFFLFFSLFSLGFPKNKKTDTINLHCFIFTSVVKVRESPHQLQNQKVWLVFSPISNHTQQKSKASFIGTHEPISLHPYTYASLDSPYC